MSERTIAALVGEIESNVAVPPILDVFQPLETWEAEIEDCLNWFYGGSRGGGAQFYGVDVSVVDANNINIDINFDLHDVYRTKRISMYFENNIVTGNQIIMSFIMGVEKAWYESSNDDFDLQEFLFDYGNGLKEHYINAHDSVLSICELDNSVDEDDEDCWDDDASEEVS